MSSLCYTSMRLSTSAVVSHINAEYGASRGHHHLPLFERGHYLMDENVQTALHLLGGDLPAGV
jgi:hypothetical protein